nr:hypothetical protein [Micromonospora sp. DSM 115978]
MIDVKDMYLAGLVVDAIADTILAPPGAPETVERSVQSGAHPMWFSS